MFSENGKQYVYLRNWLPTFRENPFNLPKPIKLIQHPIHFLNPFLIRESHRVPEERLGTRGRGRDAGCCLPPDVPDGRVPGKRRYGCSLMGQERSGIYFFCTAAKGQPCIVSMTIYVKNIRG